jgi:hypothetical protein
MVIEPAGFQPLRNVDFNIEAGGTGLSGELDFEWRELSIRIDALCNFSFAAPCRRTEKHEWRRGKEANQLYYKMHDTQSSSSPEFDSEFQSHISQL